MNLEELCELSFALGEQTNAGRLTQLPAPLLLLDRCRALSGAVDFADDLERQYGVECLGSLKGAHAPCYAVTIERQLEHPAVQVVCESAGEADN